MVAADAITALLSGYRPLPGIHDEMVDRDGALRAHWRPLDQPLAELGPEEISRRFAAADRHLRDSGVFYRVHEDPTGNERPWPFSHMPLLIETREWERSRPAWWNEPDCWRRFSPMPMAPPTWCARDACPRP